MIRALKFGLLHVTLMFSISHKDPISPNKSCYIWKKKKEEPEMRKLREKHIRSRYYGKNALPWDKKNGRALFPIFSGKKSSNFLLSPKFSWCFFQLFYVKFNFPAFLLLENFTNTIRTSPYLDTYLLRLFPNLRKFSIKLSDKNESRNREYRYFCSHHFHFPA